MATIWQLPPYLQLVVTIMANMVPPSKEDKMRDKRGKEAFAQSTSMIMVVSIISFYNKIFLSVVCSFLTILLY